MREDISDVPEGKLPSPKKNDRARKRRAKKKKGGRARDGGFLRRGGRSLTWRSHRGKTLSGRKNEKLSPRGGRKKRRPLCEKEAFPSQGGRKERMEPRGGEKEGKGYLCPPRRDPASD